MVEMTTEMQKCLNEMSEEQKMRMLYELTKHIFAEDEEKSVKNAKFYTCTMTKTLTFNIKANSMEEAQEWCDAHDFTDVQANSPDSWDIDYCDTVSELEDNGYAAIDITW